MYMCIHRYRNKYKQYTYLLIVYLLWLAYLYTYMYFPA